MGFTNEMIMGFKGYCAVQSGIIERVKSVFYIMLTHCEFSSKVFTDFDKKKNSVPLAETLHNRY